MRATSVVHEDMRTSPSLTSSADLSSVLALENIRQTLIRQEDTIIFLLIERAQFARNAAVYKTDVISVPDSGGQQKSLLEYLLRETERVHGKIRRYTSPDEQAFYPDSIPQIILPPIAYAEVCATSFSCCLPNIWLSCTHWRTPPSCMSRTRCPHHVCHLSNTHT